MVKGVFIDRDGTINKEVEYLNDHERFEFIEGSLDALIMLQSRGFKLILVTNQSGIANGKISWPQLEAIHRKMLSMMKAKGINITSKEIFLCPHHAGELCACRKPNVKNFKEAQAQFALDPKECYVVGDKTSDIEAARRGGYRSVLVKTGYGGMDGTYDAKPDFVAKDLLEAAKMIIKEAP
ncbi:MAG: HAD-IIIA family hydrolase [Candidatus Micrarchaeota archaeon]